MNKLFLFMFAFLVVGALSVSAELNITDDGYGADFIYVYILTANNTNFTTSTPTINYYFKSPDGLTANCSLEFLLPTHWYGDNFTTMNNTNSTILVNTSLADGTYHYAVFCIDDARYSDFTIHFNLSVNTSGGPPLNITSYVPTNLTPTYQENVSVLFNMTVVDGTAPYSFEWFLDGASQAVTQFWLWLIGYYDAGNHTVVGVVTDDDSTVLNTTWDVTVENTYVELSSPDSINPGAGSYDYVIPVSCNAHNPDPVMFVMEFNPNGAGWLPLFNSTLNIGFFDMVNINYSEFVNFRCRVIDDNNVSSAFTTSDRIYRQRAFTFKTYASGSINTFFNGEVYEFGVLGDVNDEPGVKIKSLFMDCNGDGLWDYYEDNSSAWKGYDSVTKFNRFFDCIFPKGTITMSVGMLMSVNTSWTDTEFNSCYEFGSKDCRIIKNYLVYVI